jgi:hypothetical protein
MPLQGIGAPGRALVLGIFMMSQDDETDGPRLPGAPSTSDIDPRVRRTLELVYQVEGVVAAKVWAMPDRVAVGVKLGNGHGAPDVIARIQVVTAALRAPGEAWDFGLLEGDA